MIYYVLFSSSFSQFVDKIGYSLPKKDIQPFPPKVRSRSDLLGCLNGQVLGQIDTLDDHVFLKETVFAPGTNIKTYRPNAVTGT